MYIAEADYEMVSLKYLYWKVRMNRSQIYLLEPRKVVNYKCQKLVSSQTFPFMGMFDLDEDLIILQLIT